MSTFPKVLSVVLVLLAISLGGVAWLCGHRLVRTVLMPPAHEFAAWQQLEQGLRWVGHGIGHLGDAGTKARSFAELALALTNDVVLSGLLTEGVSPESPNPFPGVLPRGGYSRTLQLPSGFNPTNVPVVWRPIRYGRDMVVYLPWSGGDAISVSLEDFRFLMRRLAEQGFPTNLVQVWPAAEEAN